MFIYIYCNFIIINLIKDKKGRLGTLLRIQDGDLINISHE